MHAPRTDDTLYLKRWELFFAIQAERPQDLKPGEVVEARTASEDKTLDVGAPRKVVGSGSAR